MPLDPVLAAVGLSAVAGIASTWAAQRLRIPAIVLYCLAGLVLGASGLWWIDLTAEVGGAPLSGFVRGVVPLLVAVVVFEGALLLEPEGLQRAPKAVGGLLRSGALITFVLGAGAAWLLLDLDPARAAVLGAVFVVTGPTVIQPILRRVRLRPAVDATLRWESILIDPLGALLAVAVIEIAAHASGTTEAAVIAVRAAGGLVVGGVIGFLVAHGARLLLTDPRTHASREDDLNAVVLLGATLLAFLLSEAVLAESGLMAVVVMGLVAARSGFFGLHDVRLFKSQIATLVVSTLFVLLASAGANGWSNLVDPRVLAFCAVLVLVVRPLSVAAATRGSALTGRERAYVALLAPKGIVAAALASFAAATLGEPVDAAPDALPLGDAALATIMVCVIVYGFAAAPLARLLQVAEPVRERLLLVGAGPFARGFAQAAYEVGVDVSLVDSNRANVRAAVREGLDAREENALDVERLEARGLLGVRAVVALTPNDGTNALICNALEEAVGRAATWQVVNRPPDAGGEAAVQHGGRPAFREPLDLAGVRYALAAGNLVVEAVRHGEDEALPRPLVGPQLTLLVARKGTWSLCGPGEAPDDLQPGEAAVVLRAPDGVENSLVLDLVRAPLAGAEVLETDEVEAAAADDEAGATDEE